MNNFDPVYYDLSIKYQNKLDKIGNINKINIVKITNNEIFTNYKRKHIQKCCIYLVCLFLLLFVYFLFFNFRS